MTTPTFIVPKLFGYAPPVAQRTIDEWQAQLDHEFYQGPRGTRLLIRWEPSEPWQSLDRWMLWIARDPRHVETEPWIVEALWGPNPRSKGHYCAPGWCLCLEDEAKRYRWTGGATRQVDSATWRIFRETGLYATRWWVIQGSRGGHRYIWDREELASVASQMKGFGPQPPAIGDLPYADFDMRTLRAIRAEKKAGRATRALQKLAGVKQQMALDDRDEAERVAKALWDWTGEQASQLWAEGGDAIPIWAEQEYGRAPIGHRIDYAAQERFTERSLTRPVT